MRFNLSYIYFPIYFAAFLFVTFIPQEKSDIRWAALMVMYVIAVPLFVFHFYKIIKKKIAEKKNKSDRNED